MSKINNDSDKHEVLAELKKEVIDNQQNKTILTNQTFVLPVSHSTRTKPVVRKEQENKKDAGNYFFSLVLFLSLTDV